jgi:hypothetical protein
MPEFKYIHCVNPSCYQNNHNFSQGYGIRMMMSHNGLYMIFYCQSCGAIWNLPIGEVLL